MSPSIGTPLQGTSVEEEYQVVKRGREYQGCGEEYNGENGNQYHLPYNIMAVGKGAKILGEKNKILKISTQIHE